MVTAHKPKCCPYADIVDLVEGPFKSPYKGQTDADGDDYDDDTIRRAHTRGTCSRCGKPNYIYDYHQKPSVWNSHQEKHGTAVVALTCWRLEIEKVMRQNGDDMANVEAFAPESGDWLDWDFDDGFGGTNGVQFLVWTERYVYFPVCYDGAEWAGAVPRHPCDTPPTYHFGGG